MSRCIDMGITRTRPTALVALAALAIGRGSGDDDAAADPAVPVQEC